MLLGLSACLGVALYETSRELNRTSAAKIAVASARLGERTALRELMTFRANQMDMEQSILIRKLESDMYTKFRPILTAVGLIDDRAQVAMKSLSVLTDSTVLHTDDRPSLDSMLSEYRASVLAIFKTFITTQAQTLNLTNAEAFSIVESSRQAAESDVNPSHDLSVLSAQAAVQKIASDLSTSLMTTFSPGCLMGSRWPPVGIYCSDAEARPNPRTEVLLILSPAGLRYKDRWTQVEVNGKPVQPDDLGVIRYPIYSTLNDTLKLNYRILNELTGEVILQEHTFYPRYDQVSERLRFDHRKRA